MHLDERLAIELTSELARRGVDRGGEAQIDITSAALENPNCPTARPLG
jgi:hypothetical protein